MVIAVMSYWWNPRSPNLNLLGPDLEKRKCQGVDREVRISPKILFVNKASCDSKIEAQIFCFLQSASEGEAGGVSPVVLGIIKNFSFQGYQYSV